MIDQLVAALKEEFDQKVSFLPHLPTTFTVPSVVVAPADPFLKNTTFAKILERWDVLVVVSLKGPDRGLAQMRELSLKVRKAVSGSGGLWRQATGPRFGSESDLSFVISENQVEFAYDPTSITDQGETTP